MPIGECQADSALGDQYLTLQSEDRALEVRCPLGGASASSSGEKHLFTLPFYLVPRGDPRFMV